MPSPRSVALGEEWGGWGDQRQGITGSNNCVSPGTKWSVASISHMCAEPFRVVGVTPASLRLLWSNDSGLLPILLKL